MAWTKAGLSAHLGLYQSTTAAGAHRRTMVLPALVIEAVNEGDVSAVAAWLDGGGDVNDTVGGHTQYFMEGDTMLMAVAQVESFTRAHIALAKLLVQHGADPSATNAILWCTRPPPLRPLPTGL